MPGAQVCRRGVPDRPRCLGIDNDGAQIRRGPEFTAAHRLHSQIHSEDEGDPESAEAWWGGRMPTDGVYVLAFVAGAVQLWNGVKDKLCPAKQTDAITIS